MMHILVIIDTLNNNNNNNNIIIIIIIIITFLLRKSNCKTAMIRIMKSAREIRERNAIAARRICHPLKQLIDPS